MWGIAVETSDRSRSALFAMTTGDAAARVAVSHMDASWDVSPTNDGMAN
jgi:hypothetical protein